MSVAYLSVHSEKTGSRPAVQIQRPASGKLGVQKPLQEGADKLNLFFYALLAGAYIFSMISVVLFFGAR